MNLTATSTDSIEQELVELEALIARIRARQSTLIGEIDRRQVPLGDGCRTLVEWVGSRLDVAPETARMLARLARCDADSVVGLLAEGDATFDRTVELARLAEVDTPPVGPMLGFDIAGLRRFIARKRRVEKVTEQDAFDGRHVVMQPNLDESLWKLWGTLPGYEGSVVDQVLTARAERFPTPPDGNSLTLAQRRADALVAVCQDATGGEGGVTAAVTVFVDAATAGSSAGEAGVSIESGPRVGPKTLERILCGGNVEVTALSAEGEPLSIGRRSAVVPPKLRRYVLWRDGGCAIDGCTSRYRLEAHHIAPYSEGGGTDADNLAAVCWFHHHVVIHGMGYAIDPDSPPQRRRFLKPEPGPDPP